MTDMLPFTILKPKRKRKEKLDDFTLQIGRNNSVDIHWASLNETDRLLRTFDLDYKFGPCVGIKRIERWGKYDINTSSVKKKKMTFFLS
jgi:hypothetical protein